MNVTIYSKNHCIMCDRTKKALNANNIAYTEINIDENEDAIDQIIEYGFQSAPVVRVDNVDGTNDMWCGFRVDKINALVANNEVSTQDEASSVREAIPAFV